MAITRMTLDELRAQPSKMDHAKVKATTEADIRRQMIEDGEDPDAPLHKRDVISRAERRDGVGMPKKKLAATPKTMSRSTKRGAAE